MGDEVSALALQKRHDAGRTVDESHMWSYFDFHLVFVEAMHGKGIITYSEQMC